MLELRPSCERCDAGLSEDSLDVRICSFECTFCASCADGPLVGTCPNCSGELVARPVRPPGGTHAGIVLRRYADCWRRGDLEGLVACYADDFTLHYSGSSSFAGTHIGRDAALAAMAEVSVRAPRELRSIDEVLIGDRSGALVVTEILRRDGDAHELERVLRYRIEADRLAECWLYESNQTLVDHLWR